MKIINLCIRTLPALYLSFSIPSYALDNNLLETPTRASNARLYQFKEMTGANFDLEKFQLEPRAEKELKAILSRNNHESMQNRLKEQFEFLSEALNPLRGAEKLEGNLKGWFSLRISKKIRLVFTKENENIVIGSILNHY